jgi:hypothetical protein
MKDFKLTISSLGWLVAELTKLITSNQDKAYRVNVKLWREKRSLSQNAFQHVIYGDISKYLISKGRSDWTEKVTKKNLKNKFLGWEKEEYTDIETGEITIKEVLISTAGLDVGDSFNYTTNILGWAESIGCEIKIPSKCDYRELMERQNQ